VNATSAAFRVGLTRDLVTAAGDPSFGVAPLHLLDGAADIEWNYLPAITDTLTAADAAQYDALYVAAPRVPASVVTCASS
jgi:hypothetical protein